MSTPLFSVLHATFGRPQKALAAMRLFERSAKQPQDVEYIFSVNSDDPSREELAQLLKDAGPTFRFGKYFTVVSDALGSAPAWNAAAAMSQGEILIQGQDDVEPPHNWDEELIKAIIGPPQSIGGAMQPFFIAVKDGYRKDDLCCTAIMSRSYRDLEGHFLFPEYLSVFSDDEVTYRALRNARDGKSKFIKTEIVFRHRHHYHDKTVPWDDTYARENDSKAYAVGEKLFRERNPRAATDGLKTW